MSDEYLWNGTGESDPEIARLEKTLRPLRYETDRARLALPDTVTMRPVRRFRGWAWSAGLAVAALLIATAITLEMRSRQAAQSAWNISWNGAAAHALDNGQLVETGADSAARLQSDFIGEVSVGPESRLRVVRSTKHQQQLALERGTIHALIWAPPKEFVVDTPSAKTIDLGCQYTLHVAADGAGVLHVQTGWVAFEWRNLESFIPAGATCSTRAKQGPGLPYFDDAPPALRAAVNQFDEHPTQAAVQSVLESARPRDGLTLWHLLARTNGADRSDVFDRFQTLVKLPASVTKERILKGDPAAIDAGWDALDLGDTGWWREWKRKW